MSIDNVRSKTYMAILYPDEDDSHKACLDFCKQNLDCAFILHDKDVKEDSKFMELKKPHYHVVLYFSNARYLTGVAKLLGIQPNYLTSWDSRNKALQYLIHFNNRDKYQYSIDSVGGNLKPFLVESITDTSITDLEAFSNIRDFILSFRGNIRYVDLANYCVKNGYLKFYKKFYHQFKDLISEKNFYNK